MSLLMVSIMCTGIRIVLAWSAIARVAAWLEGIVLLRALSVVAIGFLCYRMVRGRRRLRRRRVRRVASRNSKGRGPDSMGRGMLPG